MSVKLQNWRATVDLSCIVLRTRYELRLIEGYSEYVQRGTECSQITDADQQMVTLDCNGVWSAALLHLKYFSTRVYQC